MSLANIVKMAKGSEEEKVGISLKVPMTLKSRLEDFSKKNNVSVNALINAMIFNGFEDVPVEKELYIELVDLEKRLNQYLLHENEGGELFRGFYCNPGAVDNFSEELSSIISRVTALRRLLY